jgi:hypothetical protein
MNINDFKWSLAYDAEGIIALHCVPQSATGEKYPFVLVVQAGTLTRFTGEIITSDGETIDYSLDDLFELLAKLERRTLQLSEGQDDDP